MICLKNKSYELLGDFYSEVYKYVEIKLWKCNNYTINGTRFANVTCKDSDTIDNYLKQETLSFAFVNSLFAI